MRSREAASIATIAPGASGGGSPSGSASRHARRSPAARLRSRIARRRRKPGRQSQPPGPLIRSINYSFTPDARFVWHGPQAAAGVYVWAHGKGRRNTDDLRGVEPPPHVRRLNEAGYDVVRFDRSPMVDERNRAAGWLRDGLGWLRRAGYARVVTGGQSRGAWNSLQMLDTPSIADAVVAISPAAHGSGASLNLLGQTDDSRQLLADAAPQRARVVFVQFSGDGFIGDPDARLRLLKSILRPKKSRRCS